MLLPYRSILLEVCVLSILAVKCQSYEYDHDIEGYGDDDRSKIDYTKYFKKDGAAAASEQNGAFINPVNDPFKSFFFQSPIGFNVDAAKLAAVAESNKQEVFSPFDHMQAVRASIVNDGKTSASNDNPLAFDYFEAAQKRLQDKDDDAIKPGPHYVSHQVPVPKNLFNGLQKAHESREDVETIRPPVKSRNKDHNDYEGFNAYDAFENLKNGQPSHPETYLYGSGKDVDYQTGKSSSTVSQYPAATGLNPILKGVPTTSAPTYEKYNYETTPIALQSKYLEALVSTTPSPKETPVFEPELEGISEAASSNCRRIASPESAEDMNCFVCQDGKAKYTQCSYSSDDDGAESRIHFSTPIRHKRSPRRSRYDEDPYFASRERSRKAFEEFEKDHAAAESERQKDFHYVPWSPEEAESYSDEQASEAIKDAGNDCKKVEKDGVTCTVCKNAKTGGNFESCSYASAPKEHKYAYVAEKKYDSNDEPVEKEGSASENKESSEPKEESKVSELKAEATEGVPAITAYPVDKNFPELVGAGTIVREDSGSQKDDDESESDDDEKPESDDRDDRDDDEKPETESDNDDESEKKESASGDEPSYYNFNFDDEEKNDESSPYDEAASEKKEKTDAEEDDWDTYHYKIFPDFAKGAEESETQTDEKKAPPPEKQDVEDVLAEFAKKDRSNCKKAEKNGMTCFLCVDKNNVQHEECMFIQESKPKATHVAYHELQRLKDPKKEQPAESKVEKVTQHPLAKPTDLPSEKTNPIAQSDSFPSPTNKRKVFFKKVNAQTAPELAAAASESLATWVAFDQPKKHFVKKPAKDLHVAGSAPDSERIENEDNESDQEKDEKETSASNPNSEKISDDERSREEAADNAPKPKELDVGETEGAFSHETKPVYSKLYGTTLPKYMVEKTEFEKDFDAASGFD